MSRKDRRNELKKQMQQDDVTPAKNSKPDVSEEPSARTSLPIARNQIEQTDRRNTWSPTPINSIQTSREQLTSRVNERYNQIMAQTRLSNEQLNQRNSEVNNRITLTNDEAKQKRAREFGSSPFGIAVNSIRAAKQTVDYYKDAIEENRKKKEAAIAEKELNSKPHMGYINEEFRQKNANMAYLARQQNPQEQQEQPQEQEKKDNKWWKPSFTKKSDLLKDGYNIGDISGTAGATALDLIGSPIEGVEDSAMGLSRLGAGLLTPIVGFGTSLYGYSTGQEDTYNYGSGKRVWEKAIGESKGLFSEFMNNYVRPNSTAGSTTVGTLKGIGNTIAALEVGSAIGNISGGALVDGNLAMGKLNLPVFSFVSGAGNSLQEGFSQDNYKSWEVWLNAAGEGSIESFTEGMFGLFGVGGNEITDTWRAQAMDNVKTGMSKALANIGVSAAGEGSEEIAGYFMEYILHNGIGELEKLTGQGDGEAWKQVLSSDEACEMFFTSCLSTLLTMGASEFSQVDANTAEKLRAKEQELGRELSKEEIRDISRESLLETELKTQYELFGKEIGDTKTEVKNTKAKINEEEQKEQKKETIFEGAEEDKETKKLLEKDKSESETYIPSSEEENDYLKQKYEGKNQKVDEDVLKLLEQDRNRYKNDEVGEKRGTKIENKTISEEKQQTTLPEAKEAKNENVETTEASEQKVKEKKPKLWGEDDEFSTIGSHFDLLYNVNNFEKFKKYAKENNLTVDEVKSLSDEDVEKIIREEEKKLPEIKNTNPNVTNEQLNEMDKREYNSKQQAKLLAREENKALLNKDEKFDDVYESTITEENERQQRYEKVEKNKYQEYLESINKGYPIKEGNPEAEYSRLEKINKKILKKENIREWLDKTLDDEDFRKEISKRADLWDKDYVLTKEDIYEDAGHLYSAINYLFDNYEETKQQAKQEKDEINQALADINRATEQSQTNLEEQNNISKKNDMLYKNEETIKQETVNREDITEQPIEEIVEEAKAEEQEAQQSEIQQEQPEDIENELNSLDKQEYDEEYEAVEKEAKELGLSKNVYERAHNYVDSSIIPNKKGQLLTQRVGINGRGWERNSSYVDKNYDTLAEQRKNYGDMIVDAIRSTNAIDKEKTLIDTGYYHFLSEKEFTKLPKGDYKNNYTKQDYVDYLNEKLRLDLYDGLKINYDGEVKYSLDKNIANKETSAELDKITKYQRKELMNKLGINVLEMAKSLNTFAAKIKNRNNWLGGMLTRNFSDFKRANEKFLPHEFAKIVHEKIFEPLQHSLAEEPRFVNKIDKRIKSWGIKQGSKEAEAMAHYIEGELRDENGKKIKAYTDMDLARDLNNNKEAIERVKKASKDLRDLYRELIKIINEKYKTYGISQIVERQNYLTHFNLKDANNALGTYFGRLVGNKVQEDRADLLLGIFDSGKNSSKNEIENEGKTKDAPTNRNALQRKTNKTEYDAIKSAMFYARNVADAIYLTEHIQELRAFEQTILQMTGQEEISNDKAIYSDSELGIENLKLINELRENGILKQYAKYIHKFTDNLAGVNQKESKGIDLLNAFGSHVSKNMIAFNANTPFTNAISGMLALTKTDKKASMKAIGQMIANRHNNDGFLDRSDVWARRQGIEERIKNNGLGEVLNNITEAGLAGMKFSDDIMTELILRGKYNEKMETLKSEFTDENGNVDLVGLQEAAMKEADDFASRILGERSKGMTPLAFDNKFLRAFTTFQLEVNNQLNIFAHDIAEENIRNKESGMSDAKANAKSLSEAAQIVIYSNIFNNIYQNTIGTRPAFDILEVLKLAFGYEEDDDDEEENTAVKMIKTALGLNRKKNDKSTTENLKNAGTELLSMLPFVNQLSNNARIPTMSALEDIFKSVGEVAEDVIDDEGEEQTTVAEEEKPKTDSSGTKLLKSVIKYGLPTGGGVQTVRLLDAVGVLQKGGDYNKKGQLKYKADMEDLNAGDVAKALIFGKNSLPGAKEYRQRGYRPYTKKQTKALENMENVTTKEFDKFLKTEKEIQNDKTLTESGAKKNAKVKALYDNPKYSSATKEDIFVNYVANDKEKETYKFLKELGNNDSNEINGYLSYLVADKKTDSEEGAFDSKKGATILSKNDKIEKFLKDSDFSYGQNAFIKAMNSFDRITRKEKEILEDYADNIEDAKEYNDFYDLIKSFVEWDENGEGKRNSIYWIQKKINKVE